MDEPIEVEVNCPDMEIAEAIGRACVEARLAACANIVPGVVGLWWWDGAIERGVEARLALKSRAALFTPLCALIKRHHPYELPAITAQAVAASNPGYDDWLRTETGAGRVS